MPKKLNLTDEERKAHRKAWHLAWRERNREKLAAQSRRAYRKNPKKAIERTKKWLDENKDRIFPKVRAANQRSYIKNAHQRMVRTKTTQAIRDGLITRAPCVHCGNPKAQAHHDSYKEGNWLKVRFLCRLHHSAWHRLFEAEMPESNSV